jgi:aconitate hydratase
MRSNIPLIAEYAFSRYDPDFVSRAKGSAPSVIIGGENYGQGSSREHAAITPMFLGVKAVVAKSIARIHRSNLINHGVIPMLFENKDDYGRVELGDELEAAELTGQLKEGRIEFKNLTKNVRFAVKTDLTESEIAIILSGGTLNRIKARSVISSTKPPEPAI